jgi:acyl-CoA dehydrogenase
MNSTAHRTAALSDPERGLLRDSLRNFLRQNWPAEHAVQRSVDASAITALWRGVAGLGLTSLGVAAEQAGLRETLLVFEELGRASCPVPLPGAVAANLALGTQRSNAAHAILEELHRGDAMIALALGSFDGDLSAGRVELRDGALSGNLSFAEGAQTATHILVCTGEPSGVAIAAAEAAGLQIESTPGLAVPPLSKLAFDNTPAMFCGIASETLKDIALVAKLSCASRALGAAQRAFDLAVEHAKVRKQFGQLVGQFQAVQHKLADALTSLDGARLTLETAAQARDDGNPDWRVFAASALAFAGPALRAVSIETHRALGAIGYAEEHEAPRHFRRVHADLARFGGVSRARAELADFMLGPAS